MNTGISGYVHAGCTADGNSLTASGPGAIWSSKNPSQPLWTAQGTDISINGNLVINTNKATGMSQQTKVAVFKVTRNEEGVIMSTKNIGEYWIEKKPGVSIDYTVAKLLKEDLSPEEIIIKEIYTVIL
jgi:hypothetical protein